MKKIMFSILHLFLLLNLVAVEDDKPSDILGNHKNDQNENNDIIECPELNKFSNIIHALQCHNMVKLLKKLRN